MKNIYLVFYILLCLIIEMPAQEMSWHRLNPKPIEVNLKDVVQVPGSERFIAVGDNAVLMYSDDNGASWVVSYKPAEINKSSDILALNCIDSYNIVALTSYGILIKSMDSGLSWTQMDCGIRKNLLDVFFLNEDVGFITKYDTIFKTYDGGLNWVATAFNSLPSGYYPQALHFLNDSTGFVGSVKSGNYIIKTTNAGETWDSIGVNLGSVDIHPLSVYFVNNETAVLTAYENNDNYIYKTYDGGLNWTQVYSDYTNYIPYIFFTDSLNAYCIGHRIMYDNMILHSSDGGDTWYETEMCENYWDLRSLSVDSIGNGICVGDYGQILTSNNWGETWDKSWQSFGNIYSIPTSSIANDSVVFIGANNYGGGIPSGSVFKSANYGDSWECLWTDDEISDISFAEDNSGAIFSKYLGQISYTPNGGTNWFGRQYLMEEIYCGYTLNDSVGFAFTDIYGGELIRTADAWLTYEIVDIPPINYIINQIDFRNQLNGFAAIEEMGKILRTDNAGSSWYKEDIGVDFVVLSLKFADSLIGFIGCNGMIFKTIDGGETWSPTNIINANGTFFTKFNCPSPDTIYAISSYANNNLFRSVDGGDSWESIQINCTSDLLTMEFYNGEKGLVFGEGGIIFTSDSTIITGINEIQQSSEKLKVNVYPNPVTNTLNIDLQEVDNIKNLRIEVSSINSIHQNTIFISGISDQIKYDCSILKSGVYILSFFEKNKLLGSKKFIKN